MLRAASTARRTSSRSMSRGRCPRVMPPRLFTPRTWPPATPIRASSTGTLATLSASSTARRMELTVESRLTIRPLRSPLDSAAPSARNLTSSPSTSASSTHVFVLPMSSPTKYLSFFAKPPLLGMKLFFSCRGHARAGIGIHDYLPRILQIDGLHMAGIRLPLRKIVDQHFEFAGELARAEVNRHGLRIAGVCQPGHHHAQVFRDRHVDFTHAIGRARAHEINILHEFRVGLHALFALVTRQVFGNAGDDGKMQFFAPWAVQDNAMRINEGKFVAAASEGDGSALCELDAEAIWQDALHAGGFNPGNLLQLTAAGFQRNLQNTAVSIVDKLLENGFAGDDAIAVHFDLIRLQQQHAGRVQKKLRAVIGGGRAHNAANTQNEDTPIEWPASSAKFLAADFDGLLTAQVTRLVVGKQLRPVRIGFSRSRRAPRYGLHAFQTTTSFSRLTPKLFCTRSRTSAMSASMSLAEAWPAFTKNLAWRSLTRASPTDKPLSPNSSIMRPAETPGGFLKMHPALFWPSGWLERRFSLQIRIPFRISLYSLEGSSNITASIISSGAKEVCRYSKEI